MWEKTSSKKLHIRFSFYVVFQFLIFFDHVSNVVHAQVTIDEQKTIWRIQPTFKYSTWKQTRARYIQINIANVNRNGLVEYWWTSYKETKYLTDLTISFLINLHKSNGKHKKETTKWVPTIELIKVKHNLKILGKYYLPNEQKEGFMILLYKRYKWTNKST